MKLNHTFQRRQFHLRWPHPSYLSNAEFPLVQMNSTPAKTSPPSRFVSYFFLRTRISLKLHHLVEIKPPERENLLNYNTSHRLIVENLLEIQKFP